MNKSKLTIQCDVTITKNKGYYNYLLSIDGMQVCMQPKFLNRKQLGLLKHKTARLMGDEDVK